MSDLDAARKVVEECQHTPRRISLDKMSGACADCIAAHVRAVVEEKEAEWRTVLESSQARHMAMITDLRAALAKSVESNQARERILNQKGLDMLRLEHDLAERTEQRDLAETMSVHFSEERDALRAERNQAEIALKRVDGALADAATVKTGDVEAGIRALTAERERLRETINAYRRSLAQGLICLVGKPCADTSRDHRHWSQAEYDALHMMLGAALAPEAEREKKP